MRWGGCISSGLVGATLLWGPPLGAQPVPPSPAGIPSPPSPPAVPPVPPQQQTHVPGSPTLVSRTQVTIAAQDRGTTIRSLVALAERRGGFPPQRSSAGVELRVPRAQLLQVLAEIRQLGTELAHHAEVRDVSGELADLDSQIASVAASRQRVLALQASGRSTDDSLLVERQVDHLDGQLADLELARSQLQRDVDLATVQVHLAVDEPPAPEALPSPRLPFQWLQNTSLGSLQNPPQAEGEQERGAVINSMIDGGLQAELLYLDDTPERDHSSWAGGGAMRFRGSPPGWPLAAAVGMDIGLAGGNGFAYDLDFLLGLGSSASRWLSFGLLSGAAGRSWSGGRVPAAWEIPAELFVNIQLGDLGRLLLQARPQWIGPRIEARQNGSRLEFADELVLRGTLALAPLAGHDDMNDGALRLGLAYHELRDTQLWTVVFGWGGGEFSTTSRY